MGFYVRKAFSFGPFRLNLSRSGLGASFGVKGARIGLGPKGSYVHLGRGGLYYRRTLAPSPEQPQNNPAAEEELSAIESSAAQAIVDSSAAQLLQELNRIKRRVDLFPASVIAGTTLLLCTALLGTEWWLWMIGLAAVATIAVCARHSDVTDGTMLLEYAAEGEEGREFSHLQSVFRKLGACDRVWHVDAAGCTEDWKRNAGGTVLENRSVVSVQFKSPPKVETNIEVPKIKAGNRSLYFFPDRVLIYDSSGVGAVSYGDLQARAGVTQFIETENVRDATQVGTTWRYVNRDGGPDRRFGNNRQLPIMLYGELSLASHSGLNERFQCSVSKVAAELSDGLVALGSGSPRGATDVSFTVPEENKGLTRIALWSSIAVMVVVALVSLISNTLTAVEEQAAQITLQQAQENQQRLQFAMALERNLHNSHYNNVAVTVADDRLLLRFTNATKKAVRRDGVNPLVKTTLFARVLRPNTEAVICAAGFRGIRVTINDGLPGELRLDCPPLSERHR